MKEILKPVRDSLEKHKGTFALSAITFVGLTAQVTEILNTAGSNSVSRDYFDTAEKRSSNRADWPNFDKKSRIEGWCEKRTLVLKAIVNEGFDHTKDFKNNEACNNYSVDISVMQSDYTPEFQDQTLGYALDEMKKEFSVSAFAADDVPDNEPLPADQTVAE